MISQLPKIIEDMLQLQSEVSELCERVVWLSRPDLPGFDAERLREVSASYQHKLALLNQIKAEYLS